MTVGGMGFIPERLLMMMKIGDISPLAKAPAAATCLADQTDLTSVHKSMLQQ